MAPGAAVLEEIEAFTGGARTRKIRSRILWSSGIALAVAVLLFMPSVVAAPWAPVLHQGCHRGALIGERTGPAPILLLNAPYRGEGWANATSAVGGSASLALANGSAAAVIRGITIEVYHARNETVGGPGPNLPCRGPFVVFVTASGGSAAEAALLAAGSASDLGETPVLPTNASPGAGGGLSFMNGFRAATGGTVNTCDSGPATLTVGTDRMYLDVTFTTPGRSWEIPVTFPLIGLYHYLFPANGGIWSVDLLGQGASAVGDGAAFAYSPCGTS